MNKHLVGYSLAAAGAATAPSPLSTVTASPCSP